MNKSSDSYFHYSPLPPEATSWGLAVTGMGRMFSPPGEPYPPAGHPEDHAFDWEHGRMLAAWQCVLVTHGQGEFETRHEERSAIQAGDLILVCPETWHRYRPLSATGWREIWIELQGPGLIRLLSNGEFQTGVVPLNDDALVARQILEKIHQRQIRLANRFSPETTADAWQLLALAASVRKHIQPSSSPLDSIIHQAEQLLARDLTTPPSIPDLARQLGVAYSVFRREFRRQTGSSPAAYWQGLRLQKARRLVGSTPSPLKTIAAQLGFSSPYHLSSAFKKHFGISPAHWRRGPQDEPSEIVKS